MQNNCCFGDMLKDEKRKSQFKYDLGKLMGDYTVPLPLGNFNMSNTETRRLELCCRILGLTTLNSLLQYVNWLVWEVCSVT